MVLTLILYQPTNLNFHLNNLIYNEMDMTVNKNLYYYKIYVDIHAYYLIVFLQ